MIKNSSHIYVANETLNEYRENEDASAVKELKKTLYPEYEMSFE